VEESQPAIHDIATDADRESIMIAAPVRWLAQSISECARY
jgi:hypothetical protein